jgi:uncharacterized membrane protein
MLHPSIVSFRATARYKQYRLLMVLGAITLLGALLRLYHLGYRSLWYDEAVLYWIAQGNIQDVIARNAAGNSAPPLFALLLSFVLRVGESEATLRSLSWLSGVAAIPATYWLTRQFLGQYAAYFCAFVVAIAPSQIVYSQQLREYSMTFVLAILLLVFFTRCLRRPGLSNWVLFTVLEICGIFVQYGLALLVLALNLVFVAALVHAARRRELLVRWVWPKW